MEANEPEVISFVVPCVPVAQPRQRHAIINGQVRNYTPTKHPVTAFKATVKLAMHSVYQGPPLEGPLEMHAVFVMPRPQNMVWKTRPMPRVWYTNSKNDFDNLSKSVCDALTGLAWKDDGQISRAVIERWIAAGDEQPHVKVRIESVKEQT